MSKPRRTQAERRAATIERLVDATIDVLAEHGYAGASVKAICTRAGMSQGALFRHFDSRIELIAHATDIMGQRNLDSASQAIDLSDPAGIVENADAFVDALRATVRSPTHTAWREVVVAARIEPELAAAVAGSVARLEALIIDTIGIALPADDPRTLELATVVLSMMHMFDSEATTIVLKKSPEITETRLRWAGETLRREILRILAG